MKSRQGASNPKFVRRISHSLWQHSKTICTFQSQTQPHNSTSLEFKLNPPNNYSTITPQKPSTASSNSTTEELCITLEENSKCRKQRLQTCGGVKVQQFDVADQGRCRHDSEQACDIYLPIQSVSTLESIPTTRKRVADYEEQGLQTKRKQQSNYTSKQIARLLEQNSQLLHSQSQNLTQITQLTLQLHHTKSQNANLQTQLQNLLKIFTDLQNKLSQALTSNQQSTKELQKQSARIMELSNVIERLEEEVRFQRGRCEDLERVLRVREREVGELRSQRGTGRDSGRCVRSVSIQGSCFPDNAKIYTIKAEINPTKCNRYIQTQSSKLETTLKQNQLLVSCLKTKDKTIKTLQKDLQILLKKVKTLEQTTHKLHQSQKLIQQLNKQILQTTAAKYASKYKYF